MSFWNEKLVVGRKAHRCEECGCEIKLGERHTYGSGINIYGEFGTWRAHSDCLAATLENRRLNDRYDDEWSPVSEWVWEMDGVGLAALAMDHPGVFARLAATLAEHDRHAEFYTWQGFHPFVQPERRRSPYVWERLA